MSASWARRSTTFPLASSPHWAPTTTTVATATPPRNKKTDSTSRYPRAPVYRSARSLSTRRADGTQEWFQRTLLQRDNRAGDVAPVRDRGTAVSVHPILVTSASYRMKAVIEEGIVRFGHPHPYPLSTILASPHRSEEHTSELHSHS